MGPVWLPLQRTPEDMGSLVFAPPPPAGHDAWSVRELLGCPEDEKSEEYDAFVAAALEQKGLLPDGATYELGDISVVRSVATRHSLLSCGAFAYRLIVAPHST